MNKFNDQNKNICPLCGKEIKGNSITMPSGVQICIECGTKIYYGMGAQFEFEKHELEEIC